MLTSPENTPTLSETDHQKIDLVAKRLSILQSNVLDATRDIKEKRDEIIRLKKEIEYNEDILSEAKGALEATKRADATLRANIAETENQLALKAADNEKRSSEITGKEGELSYESLALTESKLRHDAEVNKFKEENAAFLAERQVFRNDLSRITEVLANISWK